MADLPQSISSGFGSPGVDQPSAARHSAQSQPALRSDAVDVIGALRQALSESTRPPASILHATAEFARILTGANGVALAVRMKGVVVCRARSGDMAPELGAPLNTDSGISGECLRSAMVMVCDDAAADPRVDPAACQSLGIRSIVAVPLSGSTGIIGILEAFSKHANAFGNDAIDSLRGLAEIAEAAYERECRAHQATRAALASATTHPRPAVPAESSAPSPATSVLESSRPIKRRYQILGIGTAAFLLVAVVAWFSWRDSTTELAASEPATPPASTSKTTPVSSAPTAGLPKPQPGLLSSQFERLRPPGILRNAAKIEKDRDLAGEADAAETLSLPAPSRIVQSTPTTTPVEPPPPVEVAVSESPSGLPNLGPTAAKLPTLVPVISQGLVDARLIRRVNPAYPPQARMLRLAGTVVLDTIVAEDGNVRSVKVISGEPVLAGAARDAVRQWRYTPALLNNKPVQVHRQLTILFKLP